MPEPRNIFVELARIFTELSPENLYCDGERSPEEANSRYAQLMEEKAILVDELGYEPEESACYDALLRERERKVMEKFPNFNYSRK